MKRTIFWALLLIAAGCSSPKNTRTADPLRVTTIVAAPSAGFGAAVYVGSVEEEASASLSFPVAGTVARTLADEGQRVRKGQLLAELDSTSARQTFDAARASLEQAEDACCTRPKVCPKSNGSKRRPGSVRPSRFSKSPRRT